MSVENWNIVILGLSITSSWGNGHATTYRALVAALVARGHRVLFLERAAPWYANSRDLEELPGARIVLYENLDELRERHGSEVRRADAVIVGSYVPEGVAVGEWALQTAEGVVGFYDIDTPITLAKIASNESDYLSAELIPRYHLYLSFTGGPMLERIATQFGSPRARPLYCSVDPARYHPEETARKWDLGFLGTYSADRQASLQQLLAEPASRWPGGRFCVAGSQYPPGILWPSNVQRIEHLPPAEHRRFYCEQVFTLNLTRAEMIKAGYSPSVRLFEAAACGTAIISDYWEGLDELLEAGEEVLVARNGEQVLHYLRGISCAEARDIGEAARRRVLAHHTSAHRAEELEGYLLEAMGRSGSGAGNNRLQAVEDARTMTS